MWSRTDNQEVGLETATLKECVIAHWSVIPRRQFSWGLKHITEVVAFTHPLAFVVQACGWVGERRVASEAAG